IRRRPRSSRFPYATLFRSRGAAILECSECGAELLGVRAIFGVVNNDKFSARPGEPGVQGFGLRTRRASRNDDNFDVRGAGYGERSEEHTSELQSRENLVCR